MNDCPLCHRRSARGNSVLCQTCRDRLTWALAEAPRLYVRGCQAVTGSSHGLSDKLSTPKPGSRSPLCDSIFELCDILARALLSWEAATRAALDGSAVSPMVRPGYAMQRAAGVIATNLTAALGPPYGIAHAARLLSLSAGLRECLRLNVLEHQLAAPCPRCDMRALVRRDGSDHVSCRVCGSAWPERHYNLLTRLLVAEQQK